MTKSYNRYVNLRHRIRRPTTTIGLEAVLAALKLEFDRLGYRIRVYGELSEQAIHHRLLADRVHFFVTRRGWWFCAGFDPPYHHGYSIIDIKVGYESIGIEFTATRRLRLA